MSLQPLPAGQKRTGRVNAFFRNMKRDRYLYLLFVLPLVYYVLFHYLPMYGVTLAFKKYNVMQGIWSSQWVGLRYFNYLQNAEFWRVVRNTIILNLEQLIFVFPVPVILALMLNELRSDKLKRITQSMSYLPHFISTVVVCGMVISFVSVNGFINNILASFGMERVPFIIRPEWFRPIYIISEIWQNTGWSSIVFLAALTAIDPELYDAGKVDGAGRWKLMRHVTIPGIMPTISIMFILRVGAIMNVGFEKVFLLYNGATFSTADVISTYVYRIGIERSSFSSATAINLFSSVVGFFFIVSANKLSKMAGESSLW